MGTSKNLKKTAQLRVDKQQLEAKLEAALEENAKLEAETESLTAQNIQLRSEVLINEHYASKAIQLDTENARLKAENDKLRNDKPQFDSTDQKKCRINAICFVIAFASVICGPYLTWISGDLLAISKLAFMTVMVEIPEYIRYFSCCTNRNRFWDITKGISAFLDLLAFLLCIMIDGGQLAITPSMVMFFGIILSKKFLPAFGRLICTFSNAF